MDQKINERIAILEANKNNIYEQLKELKNDIKDLQKVTNEALRNVQKTEDLNQKIFSINNRLDGIEQTPGKDYHYYKRLIIGALITGFMSAVIGIIL